MTSLDGWILEEVIGVGGLAKVWRAHAADGGPPVAIKILREPDRSQNHRDRFLREGHLLKRLSHPGLIRCLEVNEGPQPYLVLQLLEGDNLSERLRESGPLPIPLVFQMADRLLHTLGYLHQQGITHRDVKSSNIYFSDTDQIMLLDLGLATDPTHPLITTLGDVMGTYAYMAPEQIVGAQVDHRCDLYSLGVTLYEALAEVRPYKIHKTDKHLPPDPPKPLNSLRPKTPVRLLDVISRLMARNPADRPVSAGIARALLTTGEDHRELDAPPLLGRASARGAIEAAMDVAKTVLIYGEVASGTSRMGTYSLEKARERAMETIAVRCRAGAHPLAPIQHIIRDLTMISGVVRDTPISIGKALTDLAAEGGLLLLIENAELALQETITTLSRILRIARGVTCIITSSTPPNGIDGHRVYLRPLRLKEARQLICTMLRSNTPPPGLVSQLYRVADGLPGVIVQGLREFKTRGSLCCVGLNDDGSLNWVLDRTTSFEPTASLARLFGHVISQLKPSSRRLLELLSVSGDPLPLSLTLSLTASTPDGLAIGPLIQRGLVERQLHEGTEWLALRRPAIGALVQRSLASDTRRKLHHAIAEALRSQPESDWRNQLIAWHSALGAQDEDASEALLALGLSLHQRAQHSRALTVLNQITLVEASPVQLQARLGCVLGEVYNALDRHEDAQASFEQARELSATMDAPSLHGQILVGLAQVLDRRGLKQDAATLTEEALELLADQTDSSSLLRALLLSASYHRLSANREIAAELYNRCIDLAVDQDRRLFAAMGHGGLGGMLAEDGHLEEATIHIEQEAAYARLNQLPNQLVPTLCRLAFCYRQLGRVDLALEATQEAEMNARQEEDPYLIAHARIALADLHLSISDLETTGQILAESRLALRPDAHADLRLSYQTTSASYRLALGDRQAALATYQAAVQDSVRAGFAIVGAFFQGMIGVLTANPNELLVAMDLLEETGDRRLSAILLYFGGTVGGDAEVLAFAMEEARASGDRFLLLDVLYAAGGTPAQEEASQIVQDIEQHLPARMTARFRSHPAVRWTNNTEPLSEMERPALPHVSNHDREFSPDFELLEDEDEDE